MLERYSSYGVAMDFGISYDNELLSAGLVVKNVGAQIKGYYSTDFGDHKSLFLLIFSWEFLKNLNTHPSVFLLLPII